MKTLSKEFSFVAIDQNNPNVWSVESGGGWRMLTPNNFVSDSYFDLNGMSQREKTLFFEGASVQESIAPFHASGAAGDSIIVYDLMCTTSLTDAEVKLT